MRILELERDIRTFRRLQKSLKISKLQLRFMVKSELEQAVTAVKIQFVANAEAVVFNRLDANPKLVGDLLAGPVFGYELKNSAFSSGEIFDLRFA